MAQFQLWIKRADGRYNYVILHVPYLSALHVSIICKYDTINYLAYVRPKLTNSQLALPHRTKNITKNGKKAFKNRKKNKMLRRNGPVLKFVESVLRPEESMLEKIIVKEVGQRHAVMVDESAELTE